MPVDPQNFANAWIAAWNDRDLDAILGHYADDIVFLSPYAERVIGTGRVEGIEALRAYWRRGLAANPDLHFTFDAVLAGYDCLTILYRNHRQQAVAETVEFNAIGKVVRSFACYGWGCLAPVVHIGHHGPKSQGSAMAHTVSPLAPKSYPELPEIAGVRFATAEAGIKYKNRTDVLLAAFDPGTTVAGVFTSSKCPSAPVDWCHQSLKGGVARGLLVNSGNANAFTGMKGKHTVEVSAGYAAKALDVDPGEIFLASTGVIGEPLDPDRFATVTTEMAKRLNAGPWMDAAKAIMTTDTYAKVATATVDFDGITVSISGIAKGSGMIAPAMATMLSFVFTDAPIASGVLQGLLQPLIDKSFNAVTVDSDTSTSDTCLVFATGKAKIDAINELSDPRAQAFAEALGDVLHDLAILVVRDGEGATKMVTVNVEGAVDDRSAFRIAKSIADSPLVKTAIAGEDANWGRVVMAVGKAGEPADRDRLMIAFGDFVVAENGERAPGYDEAAVSAYMKSEELELRVGLGLGNGSATVYTCDLTHGYIDINGSYRS